MASYPTSGNDTINALDGDDQVYGLGGDDTFVITSSYYGFPGFDYFNGGAGYNKITVTTSYTNIHLTSLSASDNINEIDGYAYPPSGWDTHLELNYLAGHGQHLISRIRH